MFLLAFFRIPCTALLGFVHIHTRGNVFLDLIVALVTIFVMIFITMLASMVMSAKYGTKSRNHPLRHVHNQLTSKMS